MKFEHEAKLKDVKLEALCETEDRLRQQLQIEMAKNEELLADRRELEAGRVKLLQGLSNASSNYPSETTTPKKITIWFWIPVSS